jgi:hypothetical protein
MHEITVNLHMHTRYSDGHASHQEIAQAALQAGLDAVIVTDHNVLVCGPEDYYRSGNRKVLLLVGEEIHDQTRHPQKNHLLVFGAGRELAHLAYDGKRLLEGIRQAGGLAFIAHPTDPPAPAFNEPDIEWVDWHLKGFTGIELWNAMSEFKGLLKSKAHAIYYALNPRRVSHGPFPATLQKWDELLNQGQRVAAIGGSDAHAFQARLGPLRRVLFPYTFHFNAINTHLLIPKPLTGSVVEDRRQVLEALGSGRGFVGYDLPARTSGFRFTARGHEGTAWMGEEVPVKGGVTLQIRLPRPAEMLLIKDGKPVKTWRKRETSTYITNEPGVYRVEVYIEYLGKRRGWIYSNPIYVRS